MIIDTTMATMVAMEKEVDQQKLDLQFLQKYVEMNNRWLFKKQIKCIAKGFVDVELEAFSQNDSDEQPQEEQMKFVFTSFISPSGSKKNVTLTTGVFDSFSSGWNNSI